MHIDRHPTQRKASPRQLEDLLRFIALRWSDLTRSNYDILQSAVDPKWPLEKGQKWIVYVKDEDVKEIEGRLSAMNSEKDMSSIEVLELPTDAVALPRQGALYLPCVIHPRRWRCR